MMDGRKGTIVYMNVVGMIFFGSLKFLSSRLLLVLFGNGDFVGSDDVLNMIDFLCRFGFELVPTNNNGSNFRGSDDDKNGLFRLLP